MSAILGLGVDVVEISRLRELLERHGDRFVRRICRPGEPLERPGDAWTQHVGGIFAAKEAVLKALATGWAQGLGFQQIEIVHNAAGAPSVRLHGAAQERATTMGVRKIHLSITHERSLAMAMVVLEGESADE